MRIVVGSLLLAVGLVGLPGSAHAATVPAPNNLSLRGPYGQADIVVSIPDGTKPVRFTGRLRSSFTTPGRLVVDVNGQVRKRIPLRNGRLSVPLRRSDVRDGGIKIAVRVALRPSRDCLRDDQNGATIRDPRIVLNRKPRPPVTLADFLSPSARRFVVAVPARPSTDEQTAGLNAVLALRHVLGTGPDISVRTTDKAPRTTSTRRVVVVDEDPSGSSALAVRGGRLYVTGTREEVSKAAISLADPNVTLLKARNVTNVAGVADYSPVPASTTLDGLGVASLNVEGIGTVASTVTIPQAAFGQPISQLIVGLRGTATAVRGGQQGRVNIRWNDQLVASQVLNKSSAMALDFTVPAGNLLAVNHLTAELQYLPAGGDCRPALPGQVQLDTMTSTLVATFGDSAPPGFQRFPQSFPAEIPVFFGLAAGPAMRNAARLLDAAAAVSPLQYTVSVSDEPERRAGALVTGATAMQQVNLGAPLPDQQNLATFPPGRGTPYAALQAYQSNGDNLIVLSGDPANAARGLSEYPARQPGGWAGLHGQVYVKSSTSGRAESFNVPSTAPDGVRLQLIVGAVLTVGLLIGLLVWVWWRFRRKP